MEGNMASVRILEAHRYGFKFWLCRLLISNIYLSEVNFLFGKGDSYRLVGLLKIKQLVISPLLCVLRVKL